MLRQFDFHFSNCSDEHFRTKAKALITNENEQIRFNRSFPQIFFLYAHRVGFPAIKNHQRRSENLELAIIKKLRFNYSLQRFNCEHSTAAAQSFKFFEFFTCCQDFHEKSACPTGTRAKYEKLTHGLPPASHKIKEFSQWITVNVNTKCGDSMLRDFFCFTSTVRVEHVKCSLSFPSIVKYERSEKIQNSLIDCLARPMN